MGAAPAPDAIALLTDDHRRMQALFADYDQARGSLRKRQVVVAICTELTVHAIVEEELLYPACRTLLGDAIHEEIEADREAAVAMVADMLGMGPDSEHYDGMVRAMRRHLEHHILTEEGPGGLFDRLRRSGMDLAHLGRRMRARRRGLLGDLEQVGFVASEARTFGDLTESDLGRDRHEADPPSAGERRILM